MDKEVEVVTFVDDAKVDTLRRLFSGLPLDEVEYVTGKVTLCDNGYVRLVHFKSPVRLGTHKGSYKWQPVIDYLPDPLLYWLGSLVGCLDKKEIHSVVKETSLPLSARRGLDFFMESGVYLLEKEKDNSRLEGEAPEVVERDFTVFKGLGGFLQNLPIPLNLSPVSESAYYSAFAFVPRVVSFSALMSCVETAYISKYGDALPRGKERVRHDNINAARRNFMHLVACNADKWKSFITLTFADNITNLKEANSYFHTWMTQVNRARKKAGKPNLIYIGMTERQKRGAIHYHILCDAVCGEDFPRCEHKPLFNPWTKEWRELDYYNLPYWSYGYSSAYDLNETDENFCVEKYIAKYMTKSMETEGYSLLRSQKLKKPEVVYMDGGNIDAIVLRLTESGYTDKVYECDPPVSAGTYAVGYVEHNLNIAGKDLVNITNSAIKQGTSSGNYPKKNRITYNMRSNLDNDGKIGDK